MSIKHWFYYFLELQNEKWSLSPVLPRLLLEELIELQHLLPGDDVDSEFWQHLVHQSQVVVHQALPVTSHVVAGTPEDEHCVLAGIEQLVPTAQDPLHAGVSYDAQGGAAADISGVTPGGGGVIHADDALSAVDLFTSSATDKVTRTGDQGAGLTVHPERLVDGSKKSEEKTCKWGGGDLLFQSNITLRLTLGLLIPCGITSGTASRIFMLVSHHICQKFNNSFFFKSQKGCESSVKPWLIQKYAKHREMHT